MKYCLIGFGVFVILCAIVAWACCATAGRTDERENKWRFNHREVKK